MMSRSRTGIRMLTILRWLLTLTALFCFLTIGCGGSSSDGDPAKNDPSKDGDKNPSTKKDSDAPAKITEENAKSIAADVVESNTNVNRVNYRARLDSDNDGAVQEKSVNLMLLDVAEAVKISIEGLHSDAASETELSIQTADKDKEFKMDGQCGGSMKFSFKEDGKNGSVGTITYDAFCNNGATISGKATFASTTNSETGLLETTMTFESLVTASETAKVTMNGKIKMVIDGNTYASTMDMEIKDSIKNETYRIEDYQMTMTMDPGKNTGKVTMTGRFYEPEHGYVDLSTPTAFSIDPKEQYPSSGELVLAGGKGSAGGDTILRLTAISSTECRLQADTTGDGNMDYDTGTILWSELCDTK